MGSGSFEEARSDFEQLEKMDASVAEVHATLGVLYYKSGDYERAIAEIREARRLKPSLPRLDSLLSLALAESGRDKEALPGLEKTFRTSDDKEIRRQTGLELTRVYSHLNMDRRAVEIALELRDLYKDDPEVLYNAGKIIGNSAYLTMQDLFHAPGNSLWAALAKAESFESEGQTIDAIVYYKQALEIDPHHINLHYQMGRAYLTQWKSTHLADDLAAAEAEFGRELETHPENANAAYELAGLKRNKGDYAEAERLYTSAIASYPQFEEAEVGLGAVLIEEQKASLAIDPLKRAVAQRPDDKVAWYRIAQARKALGDAAGNREAMTKFLALRDLDKNPSAKSASGDVTPQQVDAAHQ